MIRNCKSCGDEYPEEEVCGDTTGKCRTCLLPEPIQDTIFHTCPYCKNRNRECKMKDYQRHCGVTQCRKCNKDFFIERNWNCSTYGILPGELENLKEWHGYDGVNEQKFPDYNKHKFP